MAHRVASRWLRPVHRGVYLVGPLTAPFTREIVDEPEALVARLAGALAAR